MSQFPRCIALLLLIFVGLATGTKSVSAQSFDHESYPKLDFDFQSLTLDLGIQPQNLRIDGSAQYQMEANIAGADTVIFYAAHMDISNVDVGGEPADFTLHNDSLFVPLETPSQAGQQYQVTIRYSGNPSFGLLKNSSGTVWTSMLPKSQRHWVPIIDHPHVDLQTTFNISVPSGFQVQATGRKTSEEAVSVDVMRYRFTSDNQVPASSLALTIGKFSGLTTTSDSPRISLAVEQSLADSIEQQQLLQQAYDYVEQVENQLQLQYPYKDLSVVVMPDHQWETKSWGASTVFVYNNRSDLKTQLLRGIIGQWFGVYQRVGQWSQADAVMLYQTLVNQKISNNSGAMTANHAPEVSFSTIYDGFGTATWNRWQQNWQQDQDSVIKKVINDAQNGILKDLPSVVSWKDYAEYWYRKSGQPLFDISDLLAEKSDHQNNITESADSVAYKVFYNLNESEGQLKLRFESQHGAYKELTSITAYEMYGSDTDTSEVTFTGSQDSVMLQVDPLIQNLQLKAPQHPELYLDEYKPSPFLIHELRNVEQESRRVEAARKLGYHTNNPDLQLAIKDFLSKETDPKVRGALLQSLADITQGAAGTQETFLEALDSDSQPVRNAALMALQNYKENAQVLDRVQQLAENTADEELFRKATQVLMTITSAEEFTSFVDGITQQDTVGTRSIFAIRQLANMGSVDEAVAKADLFTGSEFDYPIRSAALDILIQYDATPSDWLSRAKSLLESSDPRIRFLVIEGLQRNKNQEITDFLSAYIQDEYDARVHQKVGQLLQ
jgi:aminopeptidase N